MPDTIDELVRARCAATATSRWSSTPMPGSPTPNSTRRPRALAASVHRRGRRQGHPRRAGHAQLRAVGADRGRADAHRRGVGAVEHAVAAAGTRRAAARGRRPVSGEPCRSSAATTISTMLAAVIAANLPALRDVWAADRLPPGSGYTRLSMRSAGTVTPSDTLAIMFTSGSSGPPKGVIHSHGNALGAVRSGLACPLHRRRHPAVSADAVLLGGRIRQRRAVGAAGRRHFGHRADPRAGDDAATAGARAGHAVPWLAGSGRGAGPPIRHA